MILNLDKNTLLEKLQIGSHFTSNKISSITSLQGIFIKGENNILQIYSTNLSFYFFTSIHTNIEEKLKLVIDPKKTIDFLTLLAPGKIQLEIKEKQIVISQGKTRGVFPLIVAEDFPLPPEIKEKEQKITKRFIDKNLPFILFAASTDETKAQLTGINFVTDENDMIFVATDGFRLSLVKKKKEMNLPSVIIPASFLNEIVRYSKDEKEITFGYSSKEKMVMFKLKNSIFYSRIIEGDFPAFDKVLPTEKATKAVVDTEEFLRNIKLISVFARDFSNIIILDFSKEGLVLKPKIEGGEESSAFQEILLEGDNQRIAFNYKFLIDLLNHIGKGKLIIEILRPNAPVVFKLEDNADFIHIIMPVRMQEVQS